jgi:hypothetical protein
MNRLDFANVLNDRGLTGFAAEVGSHQGGYAEPFYGRWNGKLLFCVDRYITDTGRAHTQDLVQLHEAMYALGKPWCHVGQDSWKAAASFPDDYFDFVYIDAGHDYHSVCKDLEAWWPKLKPGGLFAGHDYIDGDKPRQYTKKLSLAVLETLSYGVRSAVNQFASRHRYEVLTTDDKPTSWYWEKR